MKHLEHFPFEGWHIPELDIARVQAEQDFAKLTQYILSPKPPWRLKPMPTQKATPHNQRSTKILTAAKRERTAKKAYNAAFRALEALDPLSKEYAGAQDNLLTTTGELLEARRELRAALAGVALSEGENE